MKNYYEILGVEKNASKAQIQEVFRKLAHIYHPDKGGNDWKFKEVYEAYNVLSDDAKRAEYDLALQQAGLGQSRVNYDPGKNTEASKNKSGEYQSSNSYPPPTKPSDVKSSPSKPNGEKNRPAAVLAYLVVFGPLFTDARKDPFVIYHAKQGIVLFIMFLWAATLTRLPAVGSTLAGLLIILWIYVWFIGIFGAAIGKKMPLPLAGIKDFKPLIVTTILSLVVTINVLQIKQPENNANYAGENRPTNTPIANTQPKAAENDQASVPKTNPEKPTTPPAATQNECLHAGAVQFSAAEKSRMKEIMLTVMQGSADMPTPAVYNEFWSIMNSHGNLCQEDIALTKDSLAAATQCTRLFYQDSLVTLSEGMPYKSPQRLDCENKTIVALLSPDKASARIKANEDLMQKIAAGQPVETAAGNVVFTQEMIRSTLSEIDAKLDRLNKLYSQNSPTGSVDQASVSDNPSLDMQCEKDHGPSVYRAIPESAGGGAYCDCKPGYILKPMTTADGTLSSWCTKE